MHKFEAVCRVFVENGAKSRKTLILEKSRIVTVRFEIRNSEFKLCIDYPL